MRQGPDEVTLTPTPGLGAAPVFSLASMLPEPTILLALCLCLGLLVALWIYAWVGQG